MKKDFEEKVIRLGVIDTRKYRYRFVGSPSAPRIERIPLKDLDTTAALNGWEVVKKYN